MSKYFRSSELANEIASAVFRVAALVRHERLRKELEYSAIGLIGMLDSVAIQKLDRLVRLAKAVGEMSEVNAQVLKRELNNLRNLLNTEISESISGITESIDLRGVFTEEDRKMREKGGLEIENQGDRQEAVLEYIRKFPNGCRMRDLSAAFSGFSERTVRADVQRLIDKGLIEKVGSRTGPLSYFRMVDSSGLQPDEVNLPRADSPLPTGRQA